MCMDITSVYAISTIAGGGTLLGLAWLAQMYLSEVNGRKTRALELEHQKEMSSQEHKQKYDLALLSASDEVGRIEGSSIPMLADGGDGSKEDLRNEISEFVSDLTQEIHAIGTKIEQAESSETYDGEQLDVFKQRKQNLVEVREKAEEVASTGRGYRELVNMIGSRSLQKPALVADMTKETMSPDGIVDEDGEDVAA